MYADLHVHSYYSDGTDSPAALVKRARNLGVKVLSLVDHDTVGGINEFINEAKMNDLQAVPGVEISTSNNGVGIHILGYYIDTQSGALINYLGILAKARTENTKLIFDQLCRSGRLRYSWDQVLHHSRAKDAIYSSDVFTAMKNDHFFSSWNEFPQFYYRYFSEKSEQYINFDCCSAGEAIRVILENDGIPVLAHPKLMGDDQQIDALVIKGLMGIEAYYPAHDRCDTQRYLDMALSRGLLITGGTDWHGEMSEWNYAIGECGIDAAEFNKFREGRD